MREMRLLCAIAVILLSASPSVAFSFSFADDANTNGERGQTLFLFANVDGSSIDMTVTARDLTDGLGITEAGLPNPYLGPRQWIVAAPHSFAYFSQCRSSVRYPVRSMSSGIG